MKNRLVTGMRVQVTVKKGLLWVNGIHLNSNLYFGYGLKEQNLCRMFAGFLFRCGLFLLRGLCKLLHKVALAVAVQHGLVFVNAQLFADVIIINRIFCNGHKGPQQKHKGNYKKSILHPAKVVAKSGF
jgi:hypothetical protein